MKASALHTPQDGGDAQRAGGEQEQEATGDKHPPVTDYNDSVQQLEAASYRMMLYMKSLGIPVHERYALAEQAFNTARSLCTPEENIIPSAVAVLQEAVSKRSVHLPDGLPPEGMPGYFCSSCGAAPFFSDDIALKAMPPLNRGNMIPVAFERTGPLTFFFLLFVKLLVFPFRKPQRKYCLFIMLLLTALLYWWGIFGPGE